MPFPLILTSMSASGTSKIWTKAYIFGLFIKNASCCGRSVFFDEIAVFAIGNYSLMFLQMQRGMQRHAMVRRRYFQSIMQTWRLCLMALTI